MVWQNGLVRKQETSSFLMSLLTAEYSESGSTTKIQETASMGFFNQNVEEQQDSCEHRVSANLNQYWSSINIALEIILLLHSGWVYHPECSAVNAPCHFTQDSLWKWFPNSQREGILEFTFCKLYKLLKKDSSFINACGVVRSWMGRVTRSTTQSSF